MKNYKQLWEKLKLNITDTETLNIMRDYEQSVAKKSQTKYKTQKGAKRYCMTLRKQPWYNTYYRIQIALCHKVQIGIMTKRDKEVFYREFSEHLKLLATKKISNEIMAKWLNNKFKEYRNIHKPYYHTRKELFTPSGFKRVSKKLLSEEERASIVIDELIHSFRPVLPKPYENLELDFKLYEEDWRQELWSWCWSQLKCNKNLKILITNYNNLSRAEYKFRSHNLLGTMNRYIIPYIVTLHYSCHNMAKYAVSNKYVEEILFPANDLSQIETMNVDFFEKSKYVEEDIDVDAIDTKDIIKKIMNYFDDNYKATKNEKWIRYKQVLEMRCGFTPLGKIYTLQEIGKMMGGLTRERVRQLEKVALNHVRKYLEIE